MIREATFRSTAFNTREVRPYFINDCCFGDDLARWLIERLRAGGVKTDEHPRQEDFGWYFEFEIAARKHCCILAYQPDEPEGLWHLALERSRGFLGSILGGRSRGISEEAVEKINGVLAGAPDIRELDWSRD